MQEQADAMERLNGDKLRQIQREMDLVTDQRELTWSHIDDVAAQRAIRDRSHQQQGPPPQSPRHNQDSYIPSQPLIIPLKRGQPNNNYPMYRQPSPPRRNQSPPLPHRRRPSQRERKEMQQTRRMQQQQRGREPQPLCMPKISCFLLTRHRYE